MIKLILCSLFPVYVCGQPHDDNNFYMQKDPGKEVVLFAPDIISDEFGNRDMAISPGGDEIFYTLQFRNGFALSTIMHTKKINGQWSKPQVADFCGMYSDLEPAFSPDGKRLYFSSSRPVTGNKNKDFDIWYVTKTNGQWGNAMVLDSMVNTSEDEYYASVAVSGNIYFTRAVKDREEDIMICRFENGKYTKAESLPDEINSTGDEFNAFVDPGEKYIIYTAYKRKGNYGTGDLYISKKNSTGIWSASKNLGEKINGAGITYCPYISTDKKYFFFTSSRGIFKIPFASKLNFDDMKKLMHDPLNGSDNIYWTSADEILKDE